MESEQFELVDRGEKRDTQGRVIQKREERERILAAYDESGLTQRAFAKREGVKYSTLVWWLKQRRERDRGGAPVRFEKERTSSGNFPHKNRCPLLPSPPLQGGAERLDNTIGKGTGKQ